MKKTNTTCSIYTMLFCLLAFTGIKQLNAQSWQSTGTAEFTVSIADYPSLAFSGTTPYVAYSDGNNSSKATVMKLVGTNWETVGAEGFSAGSIQYTSLAFDGSTPYVAYRDAGNSNKATVMKFDGSNWVTVGAAGISAGSVMDVSLVLNGSTPYIAYRDGGNSQKATVMKFDGTNWVNVGIAGFSASVVTNTSLAFNGSTPYIAYRDGGTNNNQATVMKFDGTNWVNVGAAGFSAGQATYVSLAINGGSPYVAYHDVVNSDKATVMKFDGSNWVTVGTAGFSAGTADNTSIAFIGSTPYVCYRDYSVSSKGTVMKFDGANWVTVGTAGFNAGMAIFPTLVVNGSIPYVAYQNGFTGRANVMQFGSSCLPTTSSTNISICPSALPYTWNGITFNAAGTQTAHINNAGGCDSAATLTLSITTPFTPTISVAADGNNVCFGTNVTFTATPSNGGIVPTYQWKKNGVNVGTNINTYSSSALNNNDSVWCVITSNSACALSPTAISNKVKMIIKAVPAVPSISSGVTINCTIGSTTNMASNYWNTTWTSSNPSVATVTFPGAGGSNSALITALSNGTTSITFSVVNVANGCTNFASANYIVAAANAGTISAANGVCLNSNITATSNVAGGVWSFSNNKALVNTSGVLTGNSVGSGVLSYKVTNAQGCSATATKTITTYALPAAPTVSSLNAAKPYCKGATYNVTGSPTTGTWTTSNASTSAATGSPIIVTLGNTVGASSLTYTITDVNGCTANRVITATVGNCVGSRAANVVAEPMHQQINLYPNPAKGMVSLQVDRMIGNGTVIITNMYGKVVYTSIVNSPSTNVDISHLNKGLYLVSMTTNEGKMTKKLIVE